MGGFLQGLVYFLHPAIIPAFFIAFPIMLMLAVTSNNYSVKKLSFSKWKRLHKTVYIAEFAIMVHMALMGSLRLMLFLFIPLCFLQFMRRKNRV
jgi:sulfoxide reductase heme-binding subunit YedZ